MNEKLGMRDGVSIKIIRGPVKPQQCPSGGQKDCQGCPGCDKK